MGVTIGGIHKIQAQIAALSGQAQQALVAAGPNYAADIQMASPGATYTVSDEDASNLVMIFEGADQNCTVTVPLPVEPYTAAIRFLFNASGHALTFSCGSGGDVTVANNKTRIVAFLSAGGAGTVLAFGPDYS